MADFEVMAEGLAFPEGPVACDDGSVLVVEVRAERVTRVKPDGSLQVIAEIDGAPNGLAIGPDGAIYCCNNGGFSWPDEVTVETNFPTGTAKNYRTGSIDRIDPSTGRVERLYDSCDGVQLAGPNDIVFDSEGGFWFTDLGKTLEAHELHGGLYYARTDGSSIKRVVGHLGLNGVGLSPDEKTVYVGASFTRWVLAFPADPDQAAQGLGAGEIIACFPRRQFLDSLAMEADGTIAQAVVMEDSGIARVDPRTGNVERVIVPDMLTTNIAFGGKDMQTAYITASTTDRLLRTRWPAPGLRLPFNI